jgi:hypothetical protein
MYTWVGLGNAPPALLWRTLHNIRFQKTIILILASVRTSSPTVFFFSVPRRSVGDGLLLIYLQILASLTVNISKVYSGSNGGTVHSSHDTSGDSGDDSDSEMDREDSSTQELQVSTSTSRLPNAMTSFLQMYSIKKEIYL